MSLRGFIEDGFARQFEDLVTYRDFSRQTPGGFNEVTQRKDPAGEKTPVVLPCSAPVFSDLEENSRGIEVGDMILYTFKTELPWEEKDNVHTTHGNRSWRLVSTDYVLADNAEPIGYELIFRAG